MDEQHEFVRNNYNMSRGMYSNTTNNIHRLKGCTTTQNIITKKRYRNIINKNTYFS